MSVVAFCRAVQSQWQAFAQLVWPENVGQRTQAELERLTTELARRYRALLARRGRIERLLDLLTQTHRQILQLTALAHLDEATGHQLERLLRTAARCRARLERHELAYVRQRQRFEQRKRLRLALLRGQVVVADDPREAGA